MAKSKKAQASEARVKELFGKPLEKMSVEEMQAATARLQLMREMTLLAQAEEQVRKTDENDAAIELRNEQRQAELKAIRAKQVSIQKLCRHKQGGQHQNILKGDGKPCVTAMRMLDGYTVRLACTRCRDEVYTPNPSLEAKDPKAFAVQSAKFAKFLELFEDSGLDMIRGPEFMFMRKGVPFIPERV